MQTLLLRNVQYHPDTGAVALLLEHDLFQTFVNTDEATLTALLPAGSTGENWGNAEVLLAAQRAIEDPAQQPKLAGKGYVVAFPEIPVSDPVLTA